MAPTIAVGMAQHHLGFAGSMTLRPSTLIAVPRPSLVAGDTRFRSLLFRQRAWQEHRHCSRRLFRDLCGPQPACGSRRPTGQMSAEKLVAESRSITAGNGVYGEAEGSHATPSEIPSLNLLSRPHQISGGRPTCCTSGRICRCCRLQSQLPRRPNRVQSRLRNAQSGPRLYDAAVAALTKDYLGGRLKVHGGS
jgi:creatinine amidohydrolase